jgi:hypothetical protein
LEFVWIGIGPELLVQLGGAAAVTSDLSHNPTRMLGNAVRSKNSVPKTLQPAAHHDFSSLSLSHPIERLLQSHVYNYMHATEPERKTQNTQKT